MTEMAPPNLAGIAAAGLSASVAIGPIFGVCPATRAARLDLFQALHYV